MLRAETLIVAVALTACGCDRVFSLDRAPIDAAVFDAADAQVTMLPFGTPVAVPINMGGEEDRPTLTADQLELYFHVGGQLFRSVRPDTGAPWSPREAITELNVGDVRRPCISANGMMLYFSQILAGSQADIFVSARAARTAPWGAPVALPATINDPVASEYCGWASPDGHLLLFSSNFLAGGKNDIFRATRNTKDDPYQVVELADLNSDTADGAPWAIGNGTVVMFDTGRYGAAQDIVEAQQNGLSWTFTTHPELNTSANEGSVWLSPDGTVIYFSSDRDGDLDLYMATRGTPP